VKNIFIKEINWAHKTKVGRVDVTAIPVMGEQLPKTCEIYGITHGSSNWLLH